eukprot:1114380-Prorocentrum_minimum.AAC.1
MDDSCSILVSNSSEEVVTTRRKPSVLVVFVTASLFLLALLTLVALVIADVHAGTTTSTTPHDHPPLPIVPGTIISNNDDALPPALAGPSTPDNHHLQDDDASPLLSNHPLQDDDASPLPSSGPDEPPNASSWVQPGLAATSARILGELLARESNVTRRQEMAENIQGMQRDILSLAGEGATLEGASVALAVEIVLNITGAPPSLAPSFLALLHTLLSTSSTSDRQLNASDDTYPGQEPIGGGTEGYTQGGNQMEEGREDIPGARTNRRRDDVGDDRTIITDGDEAAGVTVQAQDFNAMAQGRLCFDIMEPLVYFCVYPEPSVQWFPDGAPDDALLPLVYRPRPPVVQPVVPPVYSPLGQPVYLPVGQPVYSPVGQPVYSPAGQPVYLPAGQPVYSPAGQPVYSPAGQTVYSPAGQPVYSPVGQPVYSPAGQPVYSPGGQPVYSPVGQPVYSPVGQPVVQRVYSPAGVPRPVARSLPAPSLLRTPVEYSAAPTSPDYSGVARRGAPVARAASSGLRRRSGGGQE